LILALSGNRLQYFGVYEMNLLINVGIAVAVLILVWVSAAVRWHSSRLLTEIEPSSTEIELTTNGTIGHESDLLKLHHSAEEFPVSKLIQFSMLVIPTIVAWYFADKVTVPLDTEWYGMYYVTIVLYFGYALMLIIMDLARLQEYRSKRVFLMGAHAAMELQRAGKRRAPQGF